MPYNGANTCAEGKKWQGRIVSIVKQKGDDLMKKLLFFLAVLMCAGCAFASETAYVDGVTADRVHLRAAPAADAESLGLYFSGAQAEVSGAYGEWTQVRIGAEAGWMQSCYLQAADVNRALPAYLVSNPGSSWVNLRQAPTTDSASLAKLDNGEKVYLLGETAGGWSLVEAKGLTGYVVTDFLEQGDDVSRTRILGTTGEGDHIHAFTAPNGQTICFVAMEAEPPVKLEDVNFDGHADVVAFTAMGASNFFCEFFVWENGRYVRAEHPGISYGLCNYQLYPEKGLVHSGANNGFAGALHEDCLFRWEGSTLRLIRRAVSEEWTESFFDGDTYTQIIHSDTLHMRVWDYSGGQYEGKLVLEQILPLAAADFDEHYELEYNALWRGI